MRDVSLLASCREGGNADGRMREEAVQCGRMREVRERRRREARWELGANLGEREEGGREREVQCGRRREERESRRRELVANLGGREGGGKEREESCGRRREEIERKKRELRAKFGSKTREGIVFV